MSRIDIDTHPLYSKFNEQAWIIFLIVVSSKHCKTPEQCAWLIDCIAKVSFGTKINLVDVSDPDDPPGTDFSWNMADPPTQAYLDWRQIMIKINGTYNEGVKPHFSK